MEPTRCSETKPRFPQTSDELLAFLNRHVPEALTNARAASLVAEHAFRTIPSVSDGFDQDTAERSIQGLLQSLREAVDHFADLQAARR